MRKQWLVIFLSFISLGLFAQNQAFFNLKDLLTRKGDTIGAVRVEKRSKNQIMMTSGGDYKLTSSDNYNTLNKQIRKRFYAVQMNDGKLYLNCRKLRFEKFRFGTYYAAAMEIGGKIYFCASPVGAAATSITHAKNYNLGALGKAIACSSLVSERVYYEITPSSKIYFVGKDKMRLLLKNEPELLSQYLSANSECAEIVGHYLEILKNKTSSR